jgi:sodium/proline symporter
MIIVVIALIAAAIALMNVSSIMKLVSYAWGGFGAAFGPLVILALFWKKSNAKGAFAGMLVGFVTIILWNTFLVSDGVLPALLGADLCLYDTGLYELAPAFVLALIVNIVVSTVTGGPTPEIEAEFDEYEKALEQ